MKKFPSITKLVLATSVAIAMPTASFATNGYFAIGYGMRALGMGGASIAFPQDALAAAANPAGMAEVGTRIDVGAQLFHPPRKVYAQGSAYGFHTYDTVNPDGSHGPLAEARSGSNEFLIPDMGGNYQFNRKMSFGMTAIGNGANTRYAHNFFDITGLNPGETYGTLGVQLIQMQMLPTVTYKLNRENAVGASMIMGIQTFRAYGLGNFAAPAFVFSTDSKNLTNRGNDWSYGAGLRIGWLGHYFDDRVNVGAAFATRTYMTRFHKYGGLFQGDGSFDIPQNYGIGLAIKPVDKLTVAFDVYRILYNNIKAVGNRHPTASINTVCDFRPWSVSTCPNYGKPAYDKRLGGDNSMGFGWNNVTAYKLGLAYNINSKWTVRTGFNYGKSPVPDDQLLFNMLAPAITERHATVGFTYALNDSTAVDFSWVHAFRHSQICQNPDCKTSLTADTPGAFVAAQMYYDAVGLGLDMKF